MTLSLKICIRRGEDEKRKDFEDLQNISLVSYKALMINS